MFVSGCQRLRQAVIREDDVPFGIGQVGVRFSALKGGVGDERLVGLRPALAAAPQFDIRDRRQQQQRGDEQAGQRPLENSPQRERSPHAPPEPADHRTSVAKRTLEKTANPPPSNVRQIREDLERQRQVQHAVGHDAQVEVTRSRGQPQQTIGEVEQTEIAEEDARRAARERRRDACPERRRDVQRIVVDIEREHAERPALGVGQPRECSSATPPPAGSACTRAQSAAMFPQLLLSPQSLAK